jgi:pheromone shutdown protein TraB
MNAIEAAEQAGIDLTLIDESLRLTPEQRAVQHQRALDLALQLQSAFDASLGKRCDDRAEPPPPDALRR